MEMISDAEKAAENNIWSLMQFTENLRRQYGKEPYSMEILLKKLYVKRMAADLGISRIYATGKMVGMKTNMSRKVFKLMIQSTATDTHRNTLLFEDGLIKVYFSLTIAIISHYKSDCPLELYTFLKIMELSSVMHVKKDCKKCK